MVSFWKVAGSLVISCGLASSFVLVPTAPRPASNFGSTQWSLSAGRWSSDEPSQDPLARNMARTNVLNFLTQRAFQSFIYILISCRDPHTVRWLEQTYEFSNMETFHGTGGFNLTKWDTPLSTLMDMTTRPKDVVIVSAKRRGRGHGGWSKNNPYMEERWVEFEIDINPPSLVSRIMSVREQIANEWAADLDTMIRTNEMILSSYNEKNIASRDDECVNVDEETDECVNIEDLTAPYSESKRRNVFDRDAMMMLSNSMGFHPGASSPLRQGNFDLLCLLATQESIHRTLREYRAAQDEREVSFQWLRDFYFARVSSHFDGNQRYGRSEDFFEDLLLAPPSMKTADGKVELIDPLRIAEDIIRWRSVVAQEWKESVAETPNDHMELRRLVLDAQMGKLDKPMPVVDTKDIDVHGEFQ